MQKKQRDLSDINSQFSKKHFKVSKLKHLLNAITVRTNVDDWNRKWMFAFNKDSERKRMYCDGQKKSSLDRALNRVTNIVTNAGKFIDSVGIGDAKFPSSKRGLKGGTPTTKVKEAFSNRFTCDYTTEFRTSSVCPNCTHQLYNLYHVHAKKRYYIRGIKLCTSDHCKDHPYYHRDEVGAINILKNLLIDKGLLNANCVPYFMQRGCNDGWRKKNNSKELKAPGNKLTKAQKKIVLRDQRRRKKANQRHRKKTQQRQKEEYIMHKQSLMEIDDNSIHEQMEVDDVDE
jgi:hypothetical protein